MHGRQNGSLGKPISLKQIQNNVIFGGEWGAGEFVVQPHI